MPKTRLDSGDPLALQFQALHQVLLLARVSHGCGLRASKNWDVPRGPQVLVLVSNYQGHTFWVPRFDPMFRALVEINLVGPSLCAPQAKNRNSTGSSRHAPLRTTLHV